MKNIIKMDKNDGYIPIIDAESLEVNEIWLCYTNISEGATVEIYYGSDYKTVLNLEENTPVQVPPEYCNNGEMIKFRYVCSNGARSPFIHIIGDQSIYSNLKIVKKTNTILYCDGLIDIPIIDYLKLLAELISETTKPEAESCYEDLKAISEIFIEKLEKLKATLPKEVTIEALVNALDTVQTGSKSYIPITGVIKTIENGILTN